MTPLSVPQVADYVVSRRVGEESVLLDLQSGKYFGLDALGARLWEHVDGKRSIAQICCLLAHEYDVDAETFERDSVQLFRALEEAKLLRDTG